MLAFFGLTSDYRKNLFSVIHQIVFYGKGGYSWYDVYNLPIIHRRFIYNEISKFYEENNKEGQSIEEIKDIFNKAKASK